MITKKPTQPSAQADVPAFKVGDEVEWNSTGFSPAAVANERWLARHSKRGEVIAVIPPGASPYRIAERLDDSLFNVRPLRSGGGKPRTVESYLVAVDQKPSRGKRRPRLVYWPRVSQLVKVAGGLGRAKGKP